jgi:polyisoprenoid-binding protein YceI
MMRAVGLSAGTYELGPGAGELLVRTRRDGLAARAGHDLVLELKHWSAQLVIGESSSLAATLDARSLAVRSGTGGLKPLDDRDMAEITKNVAQKVLRSDRHPEITFSSTSVAAGAQGLEVEGDLRICGVAKPVRFTVALDEAPKAVTMHVTLVQSDWDIRPFSAFAGALKVADAVEVSARATL